ncbi:MAG: glycosyltransferase [Mycobacterium sp.]
MAPAVRQPLSRSVRFGIISTFPPTPCGVARFSAGLSGALRVHGSEVGVVRVADGEPSSDDLVVGELVTGSPQSVAECAASLNRGDVAVIQHEFGLYGGTDGEEVITLLESLQVPSILVAHTVLKDPTPQQRRVIETITTKASRVVALSDAARKRLSTVYGVDSQKVSTIPHGATLPTVPRAKRSARPTILTWGLLGPGKGIERVIDAMASLQDVPGRPRYVVAGRTHPKVLASDGEAYRESLIERARAAGVSDSVTFDARHYDGNMLTTLIQSAAVIVLPYDSTDKVSSGVLVDAVTSGRPVVATAFPHAVELLSCGAGIVVDHDEPDALQSALRRVLTQPRLAGSMASEARALAPEMAWPVVARSYIDLAQRVIAEHRALNAGR